MIQTVLNFLIPQKLISFALKAKEFLKGKKTYIAAGIIMMEALLTMLEQSLSLNTMADFAAWLQNLPANPISVKIAEALALFGIRAAITKK